MFDLASAKTRLNITGTLQDALIQTGLDAALAFAEKYCDRKFTYAAETVKFYHFSGEVMFLPRYPIEQVISKTGLPNEVKVHSRLGILEFHAGTFIEDAEISYAGGYKVLPADLLLGLWLVFDAFWPAMSGGGVATVGGGVVKAVRANGASVEFDTSGGASSASGLSSVNSSGIPVGAINILDMYRRTTC